MDLYKLYREVHDNESAVKFLQEQNILPRALKCINGHDLKLSFKEEPRWVCYKSWCKFRIGIRKNTWIEGSRIPLKTIVHFIYCWAEKMTSVKFCVQHLSMNQSTVVGWNSHIRQVCAWRVGQNGGEIDESSILGRKRVEIAWRNQLIGREAFYAILNDIVCFWRHRDNLPMTEGETMDKSRVSCFFILGRHFVYDSTMALIYKSTYRIMFFHRLGNLKIKKASKI